MAYLISVVFFLFMLVLAMTTSRYGVMMLSPLPLITLLLLSFALGIGATSFKACRLAFKASFSDASGHSAEEIGLARKFLSVTGNQFLLVAGVVFFLGGIQLLLILSQEPQLLTDPARYARYAIAMLPLFYGMVFKCLFYSAEQKVVWKYSSAP